MIDQGELFDIPSPCRRICELNNRGYCKGCFRSRDERLYWNQFSTFQKQLVVNLCEKRRLKVLAAKTASETPVLADDIADVIQPDLFQPVVTERPGHSDTAPEDTASEPQTIKLVRTEPARPPGEQFDLF